MKNKSHYKKICRMDDTDSYFVISKNKETAQYSITHYDKYKKPINHLTIADRNITIDAAVLVHDVQRADGFDWCDHSNTLIFAVGSYQSDDVFPLILTFSSNLELINKSVDKESGYFTDITVDNNIPKSLYCCGTRWINTDDYISKCMIVKIPLYGPKHDQNEIYPNQILYHERKYDSRFNSVSVNASIVVCSGFYLGNRSDTDFDFIVKYSTARTPDRSLEEYAVIDV